MPVEVPAAAAGALPRRGASKPLTVYGAAQGAPASKATGTAQVFDVTPISHAATRTDSASGKTREKKTKAAAAPATNLQVCRDNRGA